jgi:transposase
MSVISFEPLNTLCDMINSIGQKLEYLIPLMTSVSTNANTKNIAKIYSAKVVRHVVQLHTRSWTA